VTEAHWHDGRVRLLIEQRYEFAHSHKSSTVRRVVEAVRDTPFELDGSVVQITMRQKGDAYAREVFPRGSITPED
jgi:hypothetical protein